MVLSSEWISCVPLPGVGQAVASAHETLAQLGEKMDCVELRVYKSPVSAPGGHATTPDIHIATDDLFDQYLKIRRW